MCLHKRNSNYMVMCFFMLLFFGCTKGEYELDIVNENIFLIDESNGTISSAIIFYKDEQTNSMIKERINEILQDLINIEGGLLLTINDLYISGKSVYFEISVQKMYEYSVDSQEYSYSGVFSIPDNKITSIFVNYRNTSISPPDGLDYIKLLGVFNGSAFFQQKENEKYNIYLFQNSYCEMIAAYSNRDKQFYGPVDFQNMIYFEREIQSSNRDTNNRLWELHGIPTYTTNIRSIDNSSIMITVNGGLVSEVYYGANSARAYFSNGLSLSLLEYDNDNYKLSNLKIINMPTFKPGAILKSSIFELDDDNVIIHITQTIWARNIFARILFEEVDNINNYYLARYTDDLTLTVMKKLKFYPFDKRTSILRIAPNIRELYD